MHFKEELEVENATPSIKFRVAQVKIIELDHHNAETGGKVFPVSPYDQSDIPNSYSGSSTILNVDSSCFSK